MTPEEMLEELRGLRCRCGLVKVPRQTFCRKCFYALPPAFRRALYLKFGHGYEDAYTAACSALEDKGITRAL
jgi:hypothetical protein